MENEGGFLNLESEYVTISGSNFSNSFASKGGAIYFEPKGSDGVITIEDCIFFNVSTSENIPYVT